MHYSARACLNCDRSDHALVHKLLAAEDPDELRELREQLNRAIHERLEELRKEVRALPTKPRNPSGTDEDQEKKIRRNSSLSTL